MHVAADQAESKHVGDSCNRGKARLRDGGRGGRTVDGAERRTFGDEQVAGQGRADARLRARAGVGRYPAPSCRLLSERDSESSAGAGAVELLAESVGPASACSSRWALERVAGAVGPVPQHRVRSSLTSVSTPPLAAEPPRRRRPCSRASGMGSPPGALPSRAGGPTARVFIAVDGSVAMSLDVATRLTWWRSETHWGPIPRRCDELPTHISTEPHADWGSSSGGRHTAARLGLSP